MVLSIAGASQRERAAVAAFRELDKSLAATIRKETAAVVVPLMVREASARSGGRQALRAITARARYSAWRGIPGVAFGGTGAVTASGVAGRTLARGEELGSQGRRVSRFATTSRSGRTYFVTKRATRQFMPDTSSSGRAIGPAADRVGDDVLGLWVQLVEDATVTALDRSTMGG